jgi:Uma2 family endonuclease
MVAATQLEPQEPLTPGLAEERIVLNNIRWETFERLLAEAGEDRNTRFYYLHGMLEIMSPLSLHEGSNRFIESLIGVIADELNLNLRKLGSLTMKRRDLQLGGEPDSCYYIQNEPLVRHKPEIDLTTDPPPDLVLEIDITNPSSRRLPIYAHLGVPELWKYNGRTLQYYRLIENHYVPVESSSTFPWLPPTVILEYLEMRFEVGETQAIRQFRDWLRQLQG